MTNKELLSGIQKALAQHNEAIRSSMVDALSPMAEAVRDAGVEAAAIHEAGPTQRLRQNIAASVFCQRTEEDSDTTSIEGHAIYAVRAADALVAQLGKTKE